jgi:hypothetical protein
MRFFTSVLTIFAVLEPLFADSIVLDKIKQANIQQEKSIALAAEADTLIQKGFSLRDQAEKGKIIVISEDEIDSVLQAMNLVPNCLKELKNVGGKTFRITFRDDVTIEKEVVLSAQSWTDSVTFNLNIKNDRYIFIEYSNEGVLRKVGSFGRDLCATGAKN